jgi:hypothetical protein
LLYIPLGRNFIAAAAVAAERYIADGEGKNRAAAEAGLQAGRFARALETCATPLPPIPRIHGRLSGGGVH